MEGRKRMYEWVTRHTIDFVITVGFGWPTFWKITDVGPHGFSGSAIVELTAWLGAWFAAITILAVYQDVRRLRRMETEKDVVVDEPLTIFYLSKGEETQIK